MDLFLENWKRFLKEAVEEAKEKKPDCKSGNKWHDEDGKFSEKEDATSWGGGYDSGGKTDCLDGKWKTNGSGTKQITRHKCGADEDGVGKHPYKCKDGEKAWEEGLKTEDIEQQDAAYIRGIITQELQKAIRQQMKRSGCTFSELIKALNMYAAAEKGELHGKGKKK
jgi:hypothetical protein